MSLFEWLESTVIARSVGESLMFTASLSAVHILGFTLVMGSALLLNLRLLNLVLPQRALIEVTRPASRAVAFGLTISISTGVLLFSTRAMSAIQNNTFQMKMLLLLAAVVFHFVIQRRVTQRPQSGVFALQMTAVSGLTLWIGLAVAACWYILFE